MTTLQYYSESGELTVFPNHTISRHSGEISNIKSGKMMTRYKSAAGYNRVSVFHEGKIRGILVARAIASTFLGPPPTNHHTADHEDKNNSNDVLSNIRWLDKSGQSNNRTMPDELKSAFIITKDGVEHTAKEWIEIFKKQNGNKYHESTIIRYAQQQLYDFRYKTFPNLRGEVWKSIPWSKNKCGEWFISNKSRMKYKTRYTENVLNADQLHKSAGYPTIKINGKDWKCHYLSMMMFRPREYAARLSGDIILHKNDDPSDFNPFRLRWGTEPENRFDAHKNGKYDGTLREQKSVVSYINGVFEKEHESISAALRFLKKDYPDAYWKGISRILGTDVVRYGRTWKNND